MAKTIFFENLFNHSEVNRVPKYKFGDNYELFLASRNCMFVYKVRISNCKLQIFHDGPQEIDSPLQEAVERGF